MKRILVVFLLLVPTVYADIRLTAPGVAAILFADGDRVIYRECLGPAERDCPVKPGTTEAEFARETYYGRTYHFYGLSDWGLADYSTLAEVSQGIQTFEQSLTTIERNPQAEWELKKLKVLQLRMLLLHDRILKFLDATESVTWDQEENWKEYSIARFSAGETRLLRGQRMILDREVGVFPLGTLEITRGERSRDRDGIYTSVYWFSRAPYASLCGKGWSASLNLKSTVYTGPGKSRTHETVWTPGWIQHDAVDFESPWAYPELTEARLFCEASAANFTLD